MKDAPRISFCRNKYPPNLRKSECDCPLPCWRDFCYFSQLAARHACVSPAHLLPTLLRPSKHYSTEITSRMLAYSVGGMSVRAFPLLTGGMRTKTTVPVRKAVSDFSRSQPGQVWARCGPPSCWGRATWLRQRAAPWPEAFLDATL
jgi:hypothetical protein